MGARARSTAQAVGTLVLALDARHAAAQGTPAAPPAAAAQHALEVGASHQWVSNDYGDWGSVYARYQRQTTLDVWYADALAEYAFGDRGLFGGLAYRRELSARTFASVGAGVGSGAFFLPRARGDASGGVRWGPSRRLVSTLGATYLRYRGPYRDVALTLATAAYFRGAVAEVGVRANRSTPGDVSSQRAFAAVTIAAAPGQTVIVRGDAGTEGYLLLGPSTAQVAFASRGATVAWRARVSPRWTLTASTEAYKNPFYSRVGVSAGVSRSW